MQQKNVNRAGLFKTVLLTGLFVGTTDISYAYINVTVQSGKFPAHMFNYISGGVLGFDGGMNGGNAAAFLGLFLHYFIAMAYTVFFFLIFPRLKLLWYNKYLVGMLYAFFVDFTMSEIVKHLSRLKGWDFDLNKVYPDWVIFGVVFGIPIAYNAYKYYRVDAIAGPGDGDR